MPINQEKLIKLQQQKERAQIGGKVHQFVYTWLNYSCLHCVQGTARRKKKVVHKTATDDKKLQVRECGRETEWVNSGLFMYALGNIM